MFLIERRKKRQGRVCLLVRMAYASKGRIFKFRFGKVGDYVLGNLLFFSEEIKKKQFERMALRNGSTLYMVKEIGMYVLVI